MNISTPGSSSVSATVREVLPQLGLAFLMDDEAHEWAVSRSTRGDGFETLQPGSRVHLDIHDYRQFAVVQAYAALR